MQTMEIDADTKMTEVQKDAGLLQTISDIDACGYTPLLRQSAKEPVAELEL